MICPNCKTELVEVNGRYICSGCGREVPENEVMAANWDDGNTRAGLYGAGDESPEEGSQPITDYDSSLTETENELGPQVTTETPTSTETPEVNDEPTVEEVLQSQQPIKETDTSTTVPDTGFYTAPKPELDAVPSAAEEAPKPGSFLGRDRESLLGPDVPTQAIGSEAQARRDDGLVIPEAVEPVAVPPIQEIPVTISEEPVISIPSSVISTPPSVISTEAEKSRSLDSARDDKEVVASAIPEAQDSLLQGNDNGNTEILKQVQAIGSEAQARIEDAEVVPVHTEVVKDMFENTEIASAPAQDPGIYTDPSYEISQPEISQQTVNNRVTMPADKRINLVIIVVGSVLALILIVAGLLAYMYLEGVV